MEIEDVLPQTLVASFVRQYPDAAKERMQRGKVVKVVISGKPVEKGGQTYDYKMMLVEYARRKATVDDLLPLVELLRKALCCPGVKGEQENWVVPLWSVVAVSGKARG